MVKMRGLTLLCLVGFILAASLPKADTVPPPAQKPQVTGHWVPFQGDYDFATQKPDGNVIQEKQK